MNISKQLKELQLEKAILDSNCIQTSAGLEAIDPKAFLKHLLKLTEKSGALVKFILNNKDVTIDYININDFKLDPKVLATPYTRSSNNIVFIPPGLVKLQSEFCEFLIANKKAMLETDSVLLDANTIFSEYTSKPEDLMKIDIKRIPQLENIGELPKEFGKFFSGSSDSDRMIMSSVYRSYTDYNLVSEQLSNLTKEFSNISLKDIKVRVDDVFSTLDYISDQIESKNIDVAKPTAKALGGLIYNLADWVATYSLYLTKLSSASIAHQDTTKKLNGLV